MQDSGLMLLSRSEQFFAVLAAFVPIKTVDSTRTTLFLAGAQKGMTEPGFCE